ncbi:unnamed protein product [Prorocentrum cordatum]|uniref:C-type lectin domain-containing protein n=1 Tax=Prorocentrum cordatum TaxID=2364126 RepID=A0ABN9UTQ6_9DINO|nr:unnamed protein product [Polarella glacialis]
MLSRFLLVGAVLAAEARASQVMSSSQAEFTFVSDALDYDDSVQRCRDLGMEMVSITSEEQQARLAQFLSTQSTAGSQHGYIRVGLHSPGSCDWQWTDGNAFPDPPNRGPEWLWISAGEPNGCSSNEKCAMTRTDWNGKLNDSKCWYLTYFVCGAATAGGAGAGAGGAAAVGDPHLQNIHGERFDLMKAGEHVLISIPRGAAADSALLRVQADARWLGGQCADMYFQQLNVTGSWAEAKQAGGYHYSVSQHDAKSLEWVAFGKVELKVVHGRADSGLLYLNLYVKHLGRAGFTVGGLLGEDDHGDVSAAPDSCAQRLALVAGTRGGGGAEVASVAVASLA